MLRYLSVCSGVESASVAWDHLGWTPVGFSEIEPFPSAVLKHRFPNVPNFGDMTQYKEWPIEPGTIDVLVGGTPCQSFSVAGLRKGLDDPRGNLMLVYLGLAEHFRIPWLVWENVPGVLSSNAGRDFGTFLGALGELGYRWSFRVLDAQHFGVPQRRRRVFVVAHLGDRGDPAKVLFEPESLRGDTAKSSKARKGSPRGARPSIEIGGRIDCTGDGITGTVSSKWSKGTGGPAGDEHYNLVTATGPVTHALTVSDGATEDGTGRGTPIVPMSFDWQAGGGGNDTSFRGKSRSYVTDPPGRTRALVANKTLAIAFHPTQDPISSVEVTHAMSAGSRQGTASVAVATVTGTLGARASSGGGFSTDFEVAGGLQAVGFDPTGSTANVGLDLSPTLRGSGVAGNAGHHAAAMTPTMAVRRLLPVECERLQGFPDNWTLIPWKNRPSSECPDGPRYKAMGNSMAVPVMRFIGERLDRVVRGEL